jgi:hypothetical protein
MPAPACQDRAMDARAARSPWLRSSDKWRLESFKILSPSMAFAEAIARMYDRKVTVQVETQNQPGRIRTDCGYLDLSQKSSHFC